MKITYKNFISNKSSRAECVTFFNTYGYLVFESFFDNDVCDEAIKDIIRIKKDEDFKTNPNIFHYNESPRIVELWKKSDAIKKISVGDNIIEILKSIYISDPIAFSTINFIKGSEQPFHSDYFHFATVPDFYLAGVWVALEDISPDAGPLSIIPESHKIDPIWLEDLGLEIPINKSDLKNNYTFYENRVKEIIKEKNLKVLAPELNTGDALIWHANLLHGAPKIKDNEKTRFSQVTHYHFKDCQKYFNPLYSMPTKQKYALRDLDAIKIN